MIDINNDFKTFRTVYNITCDNLQDEFEYAIVPQKRLDENQFNFKKAIGYHEDSVTNTEINNSQDWYLVMKAGKDTPCKIVLDITSLDEEEIPPTRQSPIKQVRFQQSRPQTRRPIRRRQPIVSESSSDSESDVENEPNPAKNWYKYIFIFLLLLLVTLVVLWWTGYLYKLPYMARFKPSSTLIAVVQPQPQVVTTQVLQPQPQVVTTQVFQPQLPIITEIPPPQTYAPDSNFINEMRELKIDL
jgi:hypothetical protein